MRKWFSNWLLNRRRRKFRKNHEWLSQRGYTSLTDQQVDAVLAYMTNGKNKRV